MSDDTPTQRLPHGPDAGDELVEERQKSRTLMFVLIGVGAALLVAILVLLIILFSGDRGTPSASPTPSDTPSASPTTSESATPSATPTPTVEPEPEPEPTQAPPPPSTILSYGVDKSDAGCTSDGDSPSITFNWNTTGTSVSFGVGTEFAEIGPYESGLPRTGGITVNYQCGEDGPDQIYSIAVIGPNGDVIGRQTIKVRD
ncbi:hypothetical protein [Pseudolysinimonas sp.]|jgi:hypothetical protein|uniref:hypothetical protein n=1 Tax=Pseudolysinimonas sp. TaxID=2680009 RepID=UPI0037853237